MRMCDWAALCGRIVMLNFPLNMRSEWYFHKQAVFEAYMLASSTTTVEKINVQVEHAAGMSEETSGTNVDTIPPKTDIWIMDGTLL